MSEEKNKNINYLRELIIENNISNEDIMAALTKVEEENKFLREGYERALNKQIAIEQIEFEKRYNKAGLRFIRNNNK
jgi:hypothetical protein